MTNTYRFLFNLFNLITAVITLTIASGIMFKLAIIKMTYIILCLSMNTIERIVYRFIMIEVFIKASIFFLRDFYIFLYEK